MAIPGRWPAAISASSHGWIVRRHFEGRGDLGVVLVEGCAAVASDRVVIALVEPAVVVGAVREPLLQLVEGLRVAREGRPAGVLFLRRDERCLAVAAARLVG